MKTRSFALLAVVMLLTAMGLGPAHPQTVSAAITRTYDIFATDGWYIEADGNPIYMYGYVGGPEGQPAQFIDTNFNGARPGGVPAAQARPMFNATLPAGWGTALGAPTTPNWLAPTSGPPNAYEQSLMGHAQFMGPTIYAAAGDTIVIKFKNLGVTVPTAPNDPHTIHLHGLDVDVANDGVPETSGAAIPANNCADGSFFLPGGGCPAAVLPAQGAGNVIVYTFSPVHPGTYMYHCHQEADIHVQMGMIGTIVVYNPTDPAVAQGPGKAGSSGTLFGQAYDRDVILMLTEIDVNQHASEELMGCAAGPDAAGVCAATLGAWNATTLQWTGGVDPGLTALINGGGFNPVTYQPQYWQINGLSFPQTIHVDLGAAGGASFNWANWLLAHPNDDPVVTGRIQVPNRTSGTGGDKILLRMVNLGFQVQPMHMHGYHAKLIGMDQRAWTWGINPAVGKGLEQNTFTIGSGNTMEILLDIGAGQLGFGHTGLVKNINSNYSTGTQLGFDPVTNLPLDTPNGTGIPEALPLPGDAVNNPTYINRNPVTGVTAAGNLNALYGGQGNGQIFVFHNHDDYKATNNGTYPGGMFTIISPQ